MPIIKQRPGNAGKNRGLATSHSFEQLESRIAPANFSVVNLHDSGPGSLRAAIEAANDDTDPDHITLAPSLTGVILLTTPLEITTDLSISGFGRVYLYGSYKTQLMEVTNGRAHVDLTGLRFATGSADSGGALGIYEAASVNIRGCAFLSNRALSSGAFSFGGAIYNQADDVLVEACAFTGNFAYSSDDGGAGGGAIENLGSMTVSKSSFTSNRAYGAILALGGAISTEAGSTLTILSSTFASNVASGLAGTAGVPGAAGEPGVNSDPGPFGAGGRNGEAGEVGGAGKTGGEAAGGAIINYGTTTVKTSTFARNIALGGNGGDGGRGGAGGRGGSGAPAGRDESGHPFPASPGGSGGAGGDGGTGGNAGAASGGAFQNADGSVLHIERSLVYGNVISSGTAGHAGPGGTGGAIGASTFVPGPDSFEPPSRGDNGSAGTPGVPSTAAGGGIFTGAGTLALSQAIVANNISYGRGGGIDVEAGGVLQLHNSTVAFNIAVLEGGGLYVAPHTQTQGPIVVVSSILATNLSYKAGSDLFGTADLENSLLEKSAGSTVTGSGNAIDKLAYLAPLGLYGGPSYTLFPRLASAAINHGSNPDDLTTDARGDGFTRTRGSATDMGAVEVA